LDHFFDPLVPLLVETVKHIESLSIGDNGVVDSMEGDQFEMFEGPVETNS